jgi:hypothetical protein
MAGLSGWSFSYALNIASSQLWQKHLLFILGCIFVCVTLLCVLPMVLEVASGSRPPRWLTLLLAVVPVTSVLISVTNPWHGLLGNDMHLVRRADLILLGFTPGPYMKLFHLPYIYL